MSTKLTKKDKILLYILAVVLVMFGFLWFLVFPQMNKSADLDLAISDLEAQKLPMDAAIMGLKTVEENYNLASDKFAESVKNFYPYMENYEIDKMLTNLMTHDYRLKVLSLNMSGEPGGVMVEKYHAAVAEESSEEPPAETEAGIAENIPLLTSSINITAQGGRAQIQKFVDNLFADYPSIRVTGYSVEDGEADSTLTLSCDLYMQRKDDLKG